MTQIKLTSVGNSPFVVRARKPGETGFTDQPGQHYTEREAVEHATNLELENPDWDIEYGRGYIVRVETVPPLHVNVPPTATVDALTVTADEGQVVVLNGSGGDSDGTIIGYEWKQNSGPSVEIQNANTPTASFTAPPAPVDVDIVLQFQTTDNDHALSDPVLVTVTVKHINRLPMVQVGADQTYNEGQVVTLAVAASDPDGSIASVLWQQLSGPTVVLSDVDMFTKTFVAPAVSTDTVLNFQCTVTDDKGAPVSVTTSVTVRNVNVFPVADAGSNKIVSEGNVVPLDGAASDPDGTITTVLWEQLTGPIVTIVAPDALVTEFTAPQVTVDTSLTFQLSITDNDGAVTRSVTEVVVKNVNHIPVGNAGANQTVNEGATVFLDGSGVDNDGTVASYLWTQTSGPTVTLINTSQHECNFVAPAVTANTVLGFNLVVTDNEGSASAPVSVNITVRNVNQVPVVSAGSAQTVDENTASVTLHGTATDPDGTVTSIAWSQVSGPSVSLVGASTLTPSFTAPAVTADTTLTFKMDVTDNDGAVVSSVTSVTVKDVTPVGESYEGFGAISGGYGKEVIHITTLNYSGAGSISEAATATDKMIKFDVEGTINLPGDLTFNKAGCTLDGFSAPGQGITLAGGQLCVKGKQSGTDGTGSNYVFRGFRRRNASGDAIQLAFNCHDIVIDHISIFGTVDGCVDVTEGAYNITVSNSILDDLSSPNAPGPSLLAYNARRVSYLRNIFYYGRDRNPIFTGQTTQLYSTGTPDMSLLGDMRHCIVWGHSIGTYIISMERVANANVVSNLFRKTTNVNVSASSGIGRARYNQNFAKGDAYIAGNVSVSDCRGGGYPYNTFDPYFTVTSINSQNNQASSFPAPAITGPSITDKQGRLDMWTSVRANAGTGRPDDSLEAAMRAAIVIPNISIFTSAWNDG